MDRIAAVIYLIATLLLGGFLVYRLRLGRSRGAGGSAPIYAGLILILIAVFVYFLKAQPSYREWFLGGVYAAIDIGQLITLITGLILLVTGLSLHFSFWSERDREVANHLGKLKLLESLQSESRYPFPLAELLDRILKNLLGGLEEQSGAILLLNRSQRQFVLTSAAGLTKEEVALMEYYPFGRNLLSQALDDENPALSSDFRTLGGKAQLAASRFRSILVLPLISGRNKLGALVLFSEEEKRHGHDDIDILNPIAEWLSEKIQAIQLGREVGRAQRERDETRTRLDEIQKKLEHLARLTAGRHMPNEFASGCLDITGASEVWLLGLNEGRLQIYGGSGGEPDFSENFRAAIISAVPRQKPLILNQEGTDESGRAIIIRSAVIYPIESGSTALLLRNEQGAFSLSDMELRLIGIMAALAGAVIHRSDSGEKAESRRRGLEFLGRLLRLKINAADLEKNLNSFLAEIRNLLPEDSLSILFKRDDSRLNGLFCSRPSDDFKNLSLALGESSTGKTAALRLEQILVDTAAVAENLAACDEENRNILLRLFGAVGRPLFQADYPLLVDDNAAYVLTIFGFHGEIERYLESHRLISVVISIWNLKIKMAMSETAPFVAPQKAPGALLSPSLLNDLNNELAAITGYCQLIRRDPNLSGEIAAALDAMLKAGDRMAEQLKIGEVKISNGESSAADNDINQIIRETLQKLHISDNLYMIGERPFEVNLNLGMVPPLPISGSAFSSFLESAQKAFTENVSEEEIITISTYAIEPHLYMDISRHRKNFPPVEQVSGFGRYIDIGAVDGAVQGPEFLLKLRAWPVQFAYDKYSRVPSYFSFRFSAKAPAIRPRAALRDRTFTILAVDDQVVILELLAAMCQSLGHRILTARGGREALALFEANKPDLVIADLAMPGMTGLELAARIKIQSPATPVIIITGWDAAVDNARLRQAGIDHVLHKPFRLEQLTDLINLARSAAARN